MKIFHLLLFITTILSAIGFYLIFFSEEEVSLFLGFIDIILSLWLIIYGRKYKKAGPGIVLLFINFLIITFAFFVYMTLKNEEEPIPLPNNNNEQPISVDSSGKFIDNPNMDSLLVNPDYIKNLPPSTEDTAGILPPAPE